MKIAYLTYVDAKHLSGSLLKYFQLAGQLWDVERVFVIGHTASARVKEKKPDLIICHGDWMQHYKLALDLNLPYVLIEHDVMSMRKQMRRREAEQEKEMIENAMAILFTSEDHLQHCAERYRMPPSDVIHLRPSMEDLDVEPMAKLPGKTLVYAGGIMPEKQRSGAYGYRVYFDIFKAIIAQDWQVHVYADALTTKFLDDYEAIGCVTHPWVDYRELIRQMTQFTAGLQAYNKDGVDAKAFEYTQACRPNKGWDYLAAGIPTIGLNMGRTSEIYTSGGWGVTIERPEDIAKIALPKITEEMRRAEVIENDIDRLEDLVTAGMNKVGGRNERMKKTLRSIQVGYKMLTKIKPEKVQLIAQRELWTEDLNLGVGISRKVHRGQSFAASASRAKRLIEMGKAREMGFVEQIKQTLDKEVQEEAAA